MAGFGMRMFGVGLTNLASYCRSTCNGCKYPKPTLGHPKVAQTKKRAAMPRKPKPPRDDPEQSKRFIEIAREVEADGTKEEFERAFRKVVVKPKRPTPKAGLRGEP